jgi:hypothetical protein
MGYFSLDNKCLFQFETRAANQSWPYPYFCNWPILSGFSDEMRGATVLIYGVLIPFRPPIWQDSSWNANSFRSVHTKNLLETAEIQLAEKEWERTTILTCPWNTRFANMPVAKVLSVMFNDLPRSRYLNHAITFCSTGVESSPNRAMALHNRLAGLFETSIGSHARHGKSGLESWSGQP